MRETFWFWHIKQFCLLKLIIRSIFNGFGQFGDQSLSLRFFFPTSYNLVIYLVFVLSYAFSNLLTFLGGHPVYLQLGLKTERGRGFALYITLRSEERHVCK